MRIMIQSFVLIFEDTPILYISSLFTVCAYVKKCMLSISNFHLQYGQWNCFLMYFISVPNEDELQDLVVLSKNWSFWKPVFCQLCKSSITF